MSPQHVTTCDYLVRHGDCTCPTEGDPRSQRINTLADWLSANGASNIRAIRIALAAQLYDHTIAPMLDEAWNHGYSAGADLPLEDDE